MLNNSYTLGDILMTFGIHIYQVKTVSHTSIVALPCFSFSVEPAWSYRPKAIVSTLAGLLL